MRGSDIMPFGASRTDRFPSAMKEGSLSSDPARSHPLVTNRIRLWWVYMPQSPHAFHSPRHPPPGSHHHRPRRCTVSPCRNQISSLSHLRKRQVCELKRWIDERCNRMRRRTCCWGFDHLPSGSFVGDHGLDPLLIRCQVRVVLEKTPNRQINNQPNRTFPRTTWGTPRSSRFSSSAAIFSSSSSFHRFSRSSGSERISWP